MEPTIQNIQEQINAKWENNKERQAFGLGHVVSSTAITGISLAVLSAIGGDWALAAGMVSAVGGCTARNVYVSIERGPVKNVLPRSIDVEYAKYMLYEDEGRTYKSYAQYVHGLKNGLFKGNVISSAFAAAAILYTAAQAAWKAENGDIKRLWESMKDASTDSEWPDERKCLSHKGMAKEYIKRFKGHYNETKPLRSKYITSRATDAAGQLMQEWTAKQSRAAFNNG